MNTLVIEITNQKAYRRLEEMEAEKLIRVLKEGPPAPAANLSEQFAGKLSGPVADDIHRQLKQMRQEWNERT